MTLKGRLTKLEAKRSPAKGGGCWQADLDAGVWRDLNSGQAGGLLSEAEEQLAGEGGGLLLFAGKYLVGIDGAAL